MDQNRDGFIDKNDLRDTFAALGKYVRVTFFFFFLVFLFGFKTLMTCLVCLPQQDVSM